MTSRTSTPVYDILGIGFGPANLALAIALEERNSPLTARFLEARPSPEWQPGMLLDGSDIQNHPSRDLVTLRNPRSRYSFLNYLHEQGRLLRHLNLPSEFPLRKEYAGYIRWAAGFFSHLVDCNQRAEGLQVVEENGERLYEVTTMSGRRYLGRTLVMGPGRTPYIPAPYDSLRGERVFHLTQYLPKLASLTASGEPASVAVIGGSQSAVELALDLGRRFPRTRVTTYTRSHSLRQKDTSPFSEEGYFPEFTDYYFRASREGKRALDAYMHPTNYSSADIDVLRELYLEIYEQELDGDQRLFVRGNLEAVSVAEVGGRVNIDFRERNTGETVTDSVDFAVLATGFRNMGPGAHEELCPPLMAGLASRFAKESDGRLEVSGDYALKPVVDGTPPLFLNGLCESSHGIGDAGSFSLLSLRAATLTDSLSAVLSSNDRSAVLAAA
ncbi:lysine N(6)-hydroxylase/L-ornithine N(5)-oxygenase family protein [Streptomyces justiciae]|uniref:lysine N(6)-hydroxylase/L-ornithine N(5)-oxygenase family protein n=1 Tax=Streptomyces justiciae TaxID=2780140 RepID=UPI0021188C63|nr:SidA/IucD/PvdA family monooxygenase [Streptomyces justiciae]MCW8377160.1 SidA/IucD/PvdA family monooxygenase [Streptomyces justiciae]